MGSLDMARGPAGSSRSTSSDSSLGRPGVFKPYKKGDETGAGGKS